MRMFLLCALGLFSFAHATSSLAHAAQESNKRAALVAHHNLDKRAVALQGYDPVAYFHEGGSTPTKGKAEFALEHGGVTYHFVVPLHREMFLRTPARYEPAYGGWCAYAMAKNGAKVDVNPKSFIIQQGRLMLFYKALFNNTRKSWLKQSAGLLEQANAAWLELTKERFLPYAGLDNVAADSLALAGYDPVSYFEVGGGSAQRGDARWKHEHAGATYHFASEKNRDLFIAGPEAFTPAYGGWCAYGFAMKDGLKLAIDPTSYLVQNGRLLLFSLTSDPNDPNDPPARAIWNSDPENLQILADHN